MDSIDACADRVYQRGMFQPRRGSAFFTAFLMASGVAMSVASCLSLSTVPGDTGGESSSSGGESSSSGAGGSSGSNGSSSGIGGSGGMADVCGNGFISPMEECDDANKTEGDGCGLTCLLERPGVCPGTVIHLAVGKTVSIKETTFGATDKFVGGISGVPGNCSAGNWFGPDLVYQVIPNADALWTIEADIEYSNSYIHVRSQCPGSKADTLACEYRMSPGITTLSLPVQQNKTYFLAIDSYDGSSGQFALKLSLH